MSNDQAPETRKPSPAQVTLMLFAVSNNGYLTANLHRGRTARSFAVGINNGWFNPDGRITFAGRNALHRHDAAAYFAALPADHVDFEVNRLNHSNTTLPTFGGNLGSTAHVLAIPDAWIQYDVPAEGIGRFVGYNINTRKGLRVIAHIEYLRTGHWTDGAVIYLSDGKGGVQATGSIYTEVQVYGPAGGPDLRQNAADLLDRARRAHEELAARPVTTLAPHTNPNTERAETLVTVDDVAQLDVATAAATAVRYADVMPATVTEVAEWSPRHTSEVRDMLNNVIGEMYRRQQTGAGKSNHVVDNITETVSWGGPIEGTVGAGKNPYLYGDKASGPSGVPFIVADDEMYVFLEQTLRAARDSQTHTAEPKAGGSPLPARAFRNHWATEHLNEPGHGRTGTLRPETVRRINTGLARFAAPASMNPATAARLAPAVDPGQLRGQVEQLRDAIVRTIGDRDSIAGDVTAAGYRIKLHTARIATTSERARDALMKLETALSEIERGAHQIARVILSRTMRRLNRN